MWVNDHGIACAYSTAHVFFPQGWAAFSTDLGLNVITTMMIAYRIWKTKVEIESIAGYRSAPYYEAVLNIVIQSGLIYTLLLVVQLAFYIVGHPMSLIVLYCILEVMVSF